MGLISNFAHRYVPALSVHHALRLTRAIPIGRFPDGRIAKIVGTAQAVLQPMRAPLSGRECVFFRVEVHVQDTHSSGWIPLFAHIEGSVYAIDDGTESAVVEMSRAQIALMTDVDTLSRPRLANQNFVEHMLRIRGYPFYGWMADSPLSYHDGYTVRRLRCTESKIAVGERVAVSGYGLREVRRDPNHTTDYREMPTRLVFRAQRRCPLLVSDRPRTLR